MMASTIQEYDESDLVWDRDTDNDVFDVAADNNAAAVATCIPSSSGSSHLMMLSLLEYICSLHIPDQSQSQKLFKVLCDELSRFDNMAPIVCLDEMRSIRTKYLTVFSSLMHKAVNNFHKDDRHLNETRVNTFYAPSPSALQQLSLRNRRDSLSMNSSRYFNDFVELLRLGKGAFGFVFKVKSRLDGQLYAVKKIQLYQSRLDDWMGVIQESKILAGLKHRNIVGYHTAWLEFENKSDTLGDGTSSAYPLPSSSVTSSVIQCEDGNASDSSNGIYFSDSASQIKTVNNSKDINRYQKQYKTSLSNEKYTENQIDNDGFENKFENREQCSESRMDIEFHEIRQTSVAVADINETRLRQNVSRLNLSRAELLKKSQCATTADCNGVIISSEITESRECVVEVQSNGDQRSLADRCLAAIVTSHPNRHNLSERNPNIETIAYDRDGNDELLYGLKNRSQIAEINVIENVENRLLVEHGRFQSNVVIDYEPKCHVDVHNNVPHCAHDKEQVLETKPRPRWRSGPKRSHSHDPSLDQSSIEREENEKLQLVSVQNSSSFLLKGQLNLYIQMELCDLTLSDWILERNQDVASSSKDVFDCIKEKMVNGLFVQVLSGLQFIHSKGFIHRDIKPRNIFLNINPGKIPTVKIGDFGLATMRGMLESMNCSTVTAVHTGGVGTEPYASPEQIHGKPYDKKTDIYSLGVILFELYHPFSTYMERADLLKKLPKVTQIFREQWSGIALMVEHLMAVKPADRPSIEQMQNSNVFTNKKTKKSPAKPRDIAKENKSRVDQLLDENKKLKLQLIQKDRMIEMLQKSLAAKNTSSR
ncbi:eukaryotic translation initiation factor 2-alpha kinase 1-like [Tubulanus polymorphus]|uniref:eukaryotic translation initiation factor 2-alpha kinase 1-like n=1 Tax=Tubulanus polymorphus TaxID=672921 RepID=UPI003DA5DFF2